MNEEVIYERNLMGSYMKLPADEKTDFDEKMLLRRKIQGLLAMEKCFLDRGGQYWYDISGKQSLETYCRIRNIGIEFVEHMIESICNEVEILDRNLINADCLLLGADQIFVTNQNQEVVFAAYPREKVSISVQFQQLMEYLLTKIDHKDQEAVQMAYGLYEKTLDEGYNIMDVRDSIIESRRKMVRDTTQEGTADHEEAYSKLPECDSEKNMPSQVNSMQAESDHGEYNGRLKELYRQMLEIWGNWRETLGQIIPKRKQERPEVIYPEEDSVILEEKPASHPTICLSDYRIHPEGMLLYEGYENFQNIRLRSSVSMIGKGKDVDVEIERETISHYHAQIDCQEQEYYIEDLNSTNGTYVNENMLSYKERRQLKSNDIIRFADVKFRFV